MRNGNYPMYWGKPDPKDRKRKIWIRCGMAFVRDGRVSVALDSIPFGFDANPIMSGFDHGEEDAKRDWTSPPLIEDPDCPPPGYKE